MNYKLITSQQNQVIKNVIQLQKKKSARKKAGLFVVEGIRAVNEIPRHIKIDHFITTENIDFEQIPRLKDAKWYVVPESIYKSISETESPQGAMAIVNMPVASLETLEVKENGFYLLLENIQDPGNLGTMIRTAHAFNVDAVLLTKGTVDLFSPKVVRSTMSSLFHVPVICDYDVTTCINFLKEKGVKLYATNLNHEAKAVYDTTFSSPLAIVIGNEGNGISEEMKEAADEHMIIPMPGGAESLNASIATSICLYEVMRSRQK